MGGGLLGFNVSKLVSKEVSKKLRNFTLAIKKACHCEDERSEDVAIAKSLNINEITTQSPIARNDKSSSETNLTSFLDTVFSHFTSHFSRKRVAFTLAEGATHVDTCDGKRKIAFTLAEVLITLGIIGVVASLTLPSVITGHKKRVVGTRVKSAYSQLSQAIQMAQAEYGDTSGWSDADIKGMQVEDFGDPGLVKIFADKYVLPYLKVVSEPKQAMLRNIGYKQGIFYKNNEQYVSKNFRVYVAELANGTTLLFYNDGNGTTHVLNRFIILIDVNGSAGENKIGHDIFPLGFTPKYGIFTYYYDVKNKDQNWLFEECKTSGFACTEILKRNGWEIDDKYPW